MRKDPTKSYSANGLMNIGIDAVSVKRFRHIKKTEYRYWKRVFTPYEWGYAFTGSHSAERLAGIFAAKEAAMKALRKVGAKEFKKIKISHGKSGEPGINRKGCKVSITHDENMAFAVILVV